MDRIFAQVEGPQLFRIFLQNFNIFHENEPTREKNLHLVLDILLEHHINEASSTEEVKEVLMNYLNQMKVTYSIEANSSNNECLGIVEVLLDCYESDIKPELMKKINVNSEGANRSSVIIPLSDGPPTEDTFEKEA